MNPGSNFVRYFTLGILIALAIGVGVVNAQPGSTPPMGNVEANFDSVKLPNGQKITGSFGYFAGLVSGPYNGRAVGGYDGAKQKCNSLPVCNDPEDPNDGCHICTAQEIVNSIENPIAGVSGSGWAWINSGPPGYFSSLSNDCNGWTSENTESAYFSVYGAKWGFAEKYAKITSCDQELPIACCRY